MERIVLVYCVLLVCNFLVCVHTESNDERTINAYEKRKTAPSLWFGPRLGRKKRNQNIDETYNPSSLECEELEEYSKLFPCALIAKCRINEDKRDDKSKSKQFIPRLGRESGEELMNSGPSSLADKWLQNQDFVGELMSQRSPPFAPRLGRRISPFAVKLGRDSDVIAL